MVPKGWCSGLVNRAALAGCQFALSSRMVMVFGQPDVGDKAAEEGECW